MSPPVSPPRHIMSPGRVLASALVAECLGTDTARAIALMEFGGVYHNKLRLKEDRWTESGDYLRIHPQPRRFPAEGIDWSTRIVKDEPDYVIVNKPAGIPVHATCDNLVENVGHGLSRHLGIPLKTTHRLDLGTQGLVLFAKSAKFQTRFNGWLYDRLIQKRYRALVPAPLPHGEHIHYMGPGDRAPRPLSPEPLEGWKICRLSIDTTVKKEVGFEHTISLLTGRTHQIRAQFSALGSPILGDELYGSSLPAPSGIGVGETIALQAYYLSFPGEEGLSLDSPW